MKHLALVLARITSFSLLLSAQPAAKPAVIEAGSPLSSVIKDNVVE